MATYNMLNVTSLLKSLGESINIESVCPIYAGWKDFPVEFGAGVLTSTCLPAPAVLNEFCGDYTHGYFGNGLREISLDPHKVSTMCTQGILSWLSSSVSYSMHV